MRSLTRHFDLRFVAILAFMIVVIFLGCDDDISGPRDKCTTPPTDPLPVPTNLINPDTAYFDSTFTVSWDHVWTGCGGYEFGYRRAATSIWVTIDVPSESETEVTIARPAPPVNNPTSYELRVRSYWESSHGERLYSDYSQSGNVEMALPCPNACWTAPANPMPVPTNLANPATGYFDKPFQVSWDHVWTGCGGYELEYRRAETSTWVTVKVVSGSAASITIPLPSPPVNDPTSYELRVRSYWGGDCDTKVFSSYSQSSGIDLAVSCGNACPTPPANPMPVPTNLANPDTAYFNAPFHVSWDHVWTGCGGYEFEYRRAGTSTWVTINVTSGSEADVTIPLPSPPVNNPTSYELRVRSYWGGDCDTKVFSSYSQSSGIEMRVP